MSKVLEDYKQFPGLTEVYETVQEVKVAIHRKIYEIEVLKCYMNPPVHYQIECWEHEHVSLQPSHPRSEGPQGPELREKLGDVTVMVRKHLPWISEPTPEKALQQALSLLTGGE